MNRRSFTRVAAALSLLASAEATAGPWTRSLGEAYLKASTGLFLSNSFVGADGVVVGGADHTSVTTAIYGEVGLYDDLQLVLYVPYVVGINDYETTTFLSAGGGDLLIGAQWSSPWLSFPHAIRADLKIPMYDVAPRPTRSTSHPLFGDGQLDITVWLSAGDSIPIPSLPLYVFAEVGHRFRTESFVGRGVEGRSFADSLVYNGQVGFTLAGLTFAADTSGVMAYRSAEDRLTKSYVNLGGQLFAPLFGDFALEASVDGTLWASNSAKGLSVIAGVSYNLQ